MEHYIITKTEVVNSNIVISNVGYVTDKANADIINQNYIDFENWIETNKTDLESGIKSITDYFINNPVVYSCLSKTTNIDGFNISLITDINSLL